MIVLATYDIASDARRTRVSGILEGVGMRVQLSTFECQLADEASFEELLGRLGEEVDDMEDQVRLYVIDRTGFGDKEVPVRIVGSRVLEERRDFWIV